MKSIIVKGIVPTPEIGAALSSVEGMLIVAFNHLAIFKGKVRAVEFVDGGVRFEIVPSENVEPPEESK